MLWNKLVQGGRIFGLGRELYSREQRHFPEGVPGVPGAWDRGYRLYWVGCEDGDRVDLTPHPYLDYLFWKGHSGFKEMALITPSLPLGVAEYLKRRLEPQGLPEPPASKGRPLSWYSVMAAKLGGELDPERKFAPVAEKILGRAMSAAAMPSQADLERVRSLLAGKILLIDEIRSLLDQQNLVLNGNLEHVLHLLYLRGEVRRYPGVGFQAPGFPICNHCGQATGLREHQCEGCGGACFYCEECLILGESRLCRALYALPAPTQVGIDPTRAQAISRLEPQLDFPLTLAQEDACRAVRSFLMASRRQECLVWAVCGAGKTEVAFAAIADALARGQKVLYASPRREVIQELKPRFQKAFPGQPLIALYGGSPDRYYQATDLVLATTHQALRFYQAFDLVVLDEVDAFPFEGSDMLYYGVARARKPVSKAVYLSATPPPELIRQSERQQVEVVRLPVRPHGYPLPEPQIIIERSWGSLAGKGNKRPRDEGSSPGPDYGWDRPGPDPIPPSPSGGEPEPLIIPPRVLNILHQSVEGDLAQVFVFVPTVYLTRRVGEALRQAMGQPPWDAAEADWVQYTSAKDPNRDEKRQAFARGEFPILVCTTIMERGITIPRVNVVVLFADQERIFDQGTLIQMAGRAGRSPEYPEGRVWLVGLRATASMERAVAHIRAMNAEAFTRGYLRPQYYHHRCRG